MKYAKFVVHLHGHTRIPSYYSLQQTRLKRLSTEHHMYNIHCAITVTHKEIQLQYSLRTIFAGCGFKLQYMFQNIFANYFACINSTDDI